MKVAFTEYKFKDIAASGRCFYHLGNKLIARTLVHWVEIRTFYQQMTELVFESVAVSGNGTESTTRPAPYPTADGAASDNLL